MFDSVRVSARPAPTTLVLGLRKGEKLDRSSAGRDTDGWIKACAERPESTGECCSISEVTGSSGFERTIVLGLGEKGSITLETLRKAAGALARRLSAVKATGVEIDLRGAIPASVVKPELVGKAFGESLGLASWTCDQFRGKGTDKATRSKLTLSSPDASFTKGLRTGLGLGESANITRTLSQTPPNICTPAWLASEARAMARKTGMTCKVIQGAQLETEKMTGLINVGKASENKPCLIRIEYRPAKVAKSAKPVVLVGKSITYDSGGLSLKVNNGMKGMKRDMDGGAAVFGAMHAIATVIKPNFPVVALLPAAENSISDEAYRPDDVLTFRNGVTVEVTNTDAEGRLVLADALCWACDKEKPELIIDMATLTGGVVVALGSVYAGMWCDDDKLRAKLEKAAEGSGERLWRLPHHAEYNAMMRSPVADIVNSAPVREAHPIQGAAFLASFVDKDIPWAHIDIAGVHSTDRDSGPLIPGPTGFGARLLAEFTGV